MNEPIEPTRNDPTPKERVGDSRFLPVIIAAGVALLIILIAAVVLIGHKGNKLAPQDDTRSTSQLVSMTPHSDMG
ncbi:MAG TPA: hypothetical protein VIM60_07910 [Edaphobacter sp.]